LTHVDVEVPDWVAAYLSVGCLGRVAQRGLGWGHGVGVADAEEDRALDLTGLAARGVEGDLQGDAGWDVVAVLSFGQSGRFEQRDDRVHLLGVVHQPKLAGAR